MSIKMQNINIRVTPKLHENIKQAAKEMGVTQSDFVRTSVERMMMGNSPGDAQIDAQTQHILHQHTSGEGCTA